MSESPSIKEIVFELGQLLRRVIWQPLHGMMGIFHLLPPVAAVILFLLLFNVGQVREIYLFYLEDFNATRTIWALAGFALISAALYESHYRLSTLRINEIYSDRSYRGVGINLLRLRRLVAFAWSFFPWAGLAVGLFLTKDYLAERRDQLCKVPVTSHDIEGLLALPAASPGAMVASVVLLGLAAGALFDAHRKSGIAQGAIILLTPSAAVAAFVLLAGSYPADIQSVGLIAAVLIVFTGVYYRIYYLLNTRLIRFVHSSFWHRNTGINPYRRRRLVALFWALIPWIVIGLYFAKDLLQPAQIAPRLSQFSCSLETLPATSDWSIIPVAVICVIATGLLVALVMDAVRESTWTGITVASAVVAAVFVVAIMPWLGFDVIGDFRRVGPFGSMALAYLFIFGGFALLILFSQKSGFPALILVLTAVLLSVLFHLPIEIMAKWSFRVCALLAVLALVSRLGAVTLVAAALCVLAWSAQYREAHHYVDELKQVTSDTSVMSLEERFDKWIQHRDDRTPGAGDPKKPYPVFIISAEGGGIYAAVAASVFLAKLQDDCPGFSQHVFAISGVSGGAIGATIFQALSQFLPASRQIDCHPRDADGPLTRKVKDIMERDHFSPVVASIIPDLLGESNGRSEILEKSFEDFDDSAVAARLREPFLAHWFDGSVAPGLVLNATWAETGYRVAFAPFTLESSKSHDGTLYSFADARMPDEYEIPLMKAAVISARFPGILPPFSMKMSNGHWWNFVDGGYADSSGAATALALFNALRVQSCNLNVDLKVILLTSSNPQLNFLNLNGSDFHDTLTPVEAIMKVRELLGSQAVTRASDYFNPPVPCPNQQIARGWQLREVKLEDQEYSLPLGWKISDTTFKLVSYLIGRPGPCSKQASQQSAVAPDSAALSDAQNNEAVKEEKALRNNRCVMQLIEQALSGNWLQEPGGDHQN
jgi:Patatin-like phospholipase